MMFEYNNDLELLGWLAIPYLYSELAASSGWLWGIEAVLGSPDQLHLELALLLPGNWPASPECLPCTSWMLALHLMILSDHVGWVWCCWCLSLIC
jgi:hypothetical protein